MKKLTRKQLNTKLSNFDKDALINLFQAMYSNISDANDYINIRLGDADYEESYLNEAKEKVKKHLNPSRGGRTNTREAKNIVSDFKNKCVTLKHYLDLELYCVEQGINFLDRYNIGSIYYSTIERFYKEVLDTLNQSENKELFLQLEQRIRNLIKDSSFVDDGLHMYLKAGFDTLKWLSTDTHAESDAKAEPMISSASADETLSPEDADLFFHLFYPLLDFVNQKRTVNDLHDIKSIVQINNEIDKLFEITSELWKDPAPLIDEYLASEAKYFPADHRNILSGWKKAVVGRFALERNLKKGSIFISETDDVYQVKGLRSSFEEIFWFRPMPVYLNAVLLPFRDVIISDGLFQPLNIIIGKGISSSLKETYMTAKRRNLIHTSML